MSNRLQPHYNFYLSHEETEQGQGKPQCNSVKPFASLNVMGEREAWSHFCDVFLQPERQKISPWIILQLSFSLVSLPPVPLTLLSEKFNSL